MRTHSSALLLALVGFTACQPDDFVNPVDDNTGTPPADATQVYAFDAASSPRFLDANLEATIAPTAVFTVADGVLVPMPVNGALPDSAGESANLQDGVGFGTYSNPDQLGAGVDWASADPFKATVTATVVVNNPGDQIEICRSFATNCATVIFDPLDSGSGVGVVVLNVAANLPDTEIGEIAAGVSAAIRASGDEGMTIAVTDESAIVVPFLATAGTPFTFSWSTERGAIEGSLDYTVSINGTELKSLNTAELLASSIVKDHGVALISSVPLNVTGVSVSYGYEYNGINGDFTPRLLSNPVVIDGDLRLSAWSEFSPLKVFPTEDPAFAITGTSLSGRVGEPHAVVFGDGVYGTIDEPAAAGARTFIYSTEFDGDDFAGTPLAGLVDQGGTGGGFFPSPSFCYSQILPLVDAQVRAGVKAEVHRAMYGAIANGVLSVDGPLQLLVPALNANFGQSLTYTAVGNIGQGNIAGYVAIGTDYADHNIDTNITTSCDDTYSVTLTNSVSTTFVAQFNAFIAALEANNFQIRDALIGAHQITLQNYIDFKTLQAGLTSPPGVKDGVYEGDGSTECELDEFPILCEGYDCNVAVVTSDVINGTDFSGFNDLAPVPGLAAACEWGVPPTPAVGAITATVTGDPDSDHPAYAAQAAVAATPPVRETAAASMNDLVMGLFGEFTKTVFGPTIPASNFSLKLTVGDPSSGTGPAVASIVITND